MSSAGAFSLPSPAPSNYHSLMPIPTNLPHPRSKPLQAGGAKEDKIRRSLDARLLRISRRHAKRNFRDDDGAKEPKAVARDLVDEAPGYRNYGELAGDLGDLVDLIWQSGTPSLQIPYFMNIALKTTEYLPSFPPDPTPTFTLLNKLDHVFASLLVGHDIDTSEPLPSFIHSNSGFSKTDMVRIKSMAEITRVTVVEVMDKTKRSTDLTMEEGSQDEDRMWTDTGTETETETDDVNGSEPTEEGDIDDAENMAVAKVYEQTLTQLGGSLGGQEL